MDEKKPADENHRQPHDDTSPSRSRPVQEDLVDETSLDSFPASDPPSWAVGQSRRRQIKRANRRKD